MKIDLFILSLNHNILKIFKKNILIINVDNVHVKLCQGSIENLNLASKRIFFKIITFKNSEIKFNNNVYDKGDIRYPQSISHQYPLSKNLKNFNELCTIWIISTCSGIGELENKEVGAQTH